MAEWPVRGERPWDNQLKEYVDEGAATPENVSGSLATLDLPANGEELRDGYAAYTPRSREEFSTTQLSKVFRPWHIALSQLAVRGATVLCVGNSITEGNGATTMAKRWVWKFRDALRARVQPVGVVGGAGYIPSYLATAGTSVTDFPVVHAGPANIGGGKNGLGLRYRNLSQIAHTETLTFTGTGVDILWTGWSTAGSYSWAVDGGSATTVNMATGQPAAPGKGGNVTQVRGLSAGVHTLVVAWVSGNAYIEGFTVYNGDTSAGLRVWEAGHGGFATANFIGANAGWMDSIPTTADLVVIELGANDYAVPGGQVTPAVFKENLKTLIAGIRAKVTTTPTFILVAVWDNGAPTAPLAPWAEFYEAMWEVADEDAAGLTTVFDAWGRFQSHATGQAPASLVGDPVHPTDAGHSYLGNSLANFALADFA